MNTQNRLNSVSGVIFVALVAFVAGLVLAFAVPGNRNLPRIIGALCVVPGLILMLLRNLFTRDPGVAPTTQQIAAEHRLRMAFRAVGASQVLFGIAQFIPDFQMRIAVSLCGAVVSTAAIFMVPRRSVGPKGSVR